MDARGSANEEPMEPGGKMQNIGLVQFDSLHERRRRGEECSVNAVVKGVLATFRMRMGYPD